MLPRSKIVQIVLSPARHNSVFTVSGCLWIQFSLAHFDSVYFSVLLRFWHFAKILPTCLFCLLSRNGMATLLSFSTICKTHIQPVLCAEAETLPLLSALHILFFREDRVPSCLICYLRCTSSYVLPASALSTFLHCSISHFIEGVWNVSVITFSAFFCNKGGAQTVKQSVHSGWEPMQRYRQTDIVIDGDICELRKSSDLQIQKLKLSRTGPFPQKCLRTKNIFFY